MVVIRVLRIFAQGINLVMYLFLVLCISRILPMFCKDIKFISFTLVYYIGINLWEAFGIYAQHLMYVFIILTFLSVVKIKSLPSLLPD